MEIGRLAHKSSSGTFYRGAKKQVRNTEEGSLIFSPGPTPRPTPRPETRSEGLRESRKVGITKLKKVLIAMLGLL